MRAKRQFFFPQGCQSMSSITLVVIVLLRLFILWLMLIEVVLTFSLNQIVKFMWVALIEILPCYPYDVCRVCFCRLMSCFIPDISSMSSFSFLLTCLARSESCMKNVNFAKINMYFNLPTLLFFIPN